MIEELGEFQPYFLKMQLTTVQAKANNGIMHEAQQQHIFLPLSSPSGSSDSGFNKIRAIFSPEYGFPRMTNTANMRRA